MKYAVQFTGKLIPTSDIFDTRREAEHYLSMAQNLGWQGGEVVEIRPLDLPSVVNEPTNTTEDLPLVKVVEDVQLTTNTYTNPQRTWDQPRVSVNVRLSQDHIEALDQIAKDIAPIGTKPDRSMAIRWLITDHLLRH